MEIKAFKLVTGEEIIGEIEKYEDGVYYLKDVVQVGADPQQGRLVFVPFMQYTTASQEMHLHESGTLIQPVDVVEQILIDYCRMTQKPFAPTPSIIRPV